MATNGIDKPVLNLFRMLGMMQGNRVRTESSRSLPLSTMLAEGVREPDIDALAVAREHEASILTWNYRDDDVVGNATKVQVSITSIGSMMITAIPGLHGRDSDHRSSHRLSNMQS